MRSMHRFGVAAVLVPAVCAGVVYLQAGAQTAPARPPLITEALVDAGSATLTINGHDFPAGFPAVTLGMNELPVRWATESSTATWLPELQPGTYLLTAAWPDGAGAVFYLTVGAAGPAGPAGPRGPRGEDAPVVWTGAASPPAPAGSGADTAGDGGPATAADHAEAGNTHFGAGSLGSVTTGGSNSAFGHLALGSLTTGNDNAAFGRLSMRSLLGGSDNLAIGKQAMLRSTDASFNVALGSGALENSTGGQHNVALGAASLLQSQGDGNIGIGRNALRLNAAGTGNTAVGYEAGINNRTGSNNVYIGSRGENGDDGVVRIGDPAVHSRTYLAGEVIGEINVVPVYQ